LNILQQRLINQRLDSSAFTTPDQVVAWLGAVQAQDFEGAKWAVAQRMIGGTNQKIEQAVCNGTLLRTHVMRPTWHFVTPADIRWMIKLTAPRVNRILASYNRKLELDDSVLKRSHKALAKTLKGGVHLSRTELKKVLEGNGISTNNQRLIHILAQAEVDGLLCSGSKKGTYALLDERVPASANRTREEALAELTFRYFRSHGPATTKDFRWWSGLTMNNVKEGLDLAKHQIISEVFEKETYWFPADTPIRKSPAQKIFLLPAYDEYLVAYRDRNITIDVKFLKPNKPPFFDPTIVWNGRVIGTWRSSVRNGEVIIKMKPLRKFGKEEKEALAKAAAKYGKFLGEVCSSEFIR
jgi:hypothetical protein